MAPLCESSHRRGYFFAPSLILVRWSDASDALVCIRLDRVDGRRVTDSKVLAMLAETSPVMVKECKRASSPVSLKQIHHRDFPQLHTEAVSVAEGATRLAGLLSLTWDCAGSRRRREMMEQAIADVADFLMSLEKAEPNCLSKPVPMR